VAAGPRPRSHARNRHCRRSGDGSPPRIGGSPSASARGAVCPRSHAWCAYARSSAHGSLAGRALPRTRQSAGSSRATSCIAAESARAPGVPRPRTALVRRFAWVIAAAHLARGRWAPTYGRAARGDHRDHGAVVALASPSADEDAHRLDGEQGDSNVLEALGRVCLTGRREEGRGGRTGRGPARRR